RLRGIIRSPMMDSVFFDSPLSDDARRAALYSGRIFVFSPRPSTVAYVDFAKELIREAFGGRDPEKVQYEMPVEEYAALLNEMKPRFIHHPESKRHVKAMLTDFGCDLEQVYFDVPRLRSSTS